MCENIMILKIFLLLLGNFSEKREYLTDFWEKKLPNGKNSPPQKCHPKRVQGFLFWRRGGMLIFSFPMRSH
jgi:hypothetical protein